LKVVLGKIGISRFDKGLLSPGMMLVQVAEKEPKWDRYDSRDSLRKIFSFEWIWHNKENYASLSWDTKEILAVLDKF